MKKGVEYIGVGVGALIFNDQNKILLRKRGKASRNEVGKWEVPGGGVEFNETLRDAIKREIKEEFGIDIEVVELLDVYDHIIADEKQHWVSPCFICKSTSGIPSILEPDKIEEIGWFSADEIKKLPCSIVTQKNLESLESRNHDLRNRSFMTFPASPSREGELQVSVKVLLKNQEGKFLLLRRNPDKYPDLGATWDIVGGRINPGTSLLENLKREVKEEIGLDIKTEPQVIYAQDIFRPQKHVVRLTFIATVEEGTPKLSDEHIQFAWFSHDELQALDKLDQFFKEILDKGLTHGY